MDSSSTPMIVPSLTDYFLPAAARTIPADSWVFTGFNWPVIAARLARRLDCDFVQVLEAGVALDRDTPTLLSSTTDYFAYGNAACFQGSIGDVLLSLVSRCDQVMLDAANVDVLGHTNSTAVGPTNAPKVRLPGGGGAPDAAARARRLILLYAGRDPGRLQRQVEHVTTAPASGAPIILITRWGTLHLGQEPWLEVCVAERTEAFRRHLYSVGVRIDKARAARAVTSQERLASDAVLAEASARGYSQAANALIESRNS